MAIVEHVGNNLSVQRFYNRANRNFYNKVFALLAVAILFATIFAIACAEVLLEVEHVQGIFRTGCLKNDVATFTAIATIWATVGYVFFCMKASGAISAVARFDVDFDFVDKHGLPPR